MALLAALALIPGYLTVPPDWRPVAVRLACAFLVIVGSMRVIGRVRRSLEGETRSPLDPARRPARHPVLDERFTRVRDDIVFGARSRRYFETILWPRLRKLGATEMPPPERRPMARRGPSLRTLERVIAGIERRP
ncbi:MAG: hypothetical protein FJZ38_08935 [Candidatus Rokubacteria bacterium]|nr:hypothetical protein [Candidatus Rokubacteria bacterium]